MVDTSHFISSKALITILIQFQKSAFSVAVGVNNDDSINTNIYFCVRNAASGDAFGIAYLGGACLDDKQYKTVVMEWDHNDLVVARVSS